MARETHKPHHDSTATCCRFKKKKKTTKRVGASVLPFLLETPARIHISKTIAQDNGDVENHTLEERKQCQCQSLEASRFIVV